MLCFQRHKLYSICIWFILHLLKKCSKILRNLSKREHKTVCHGTVLMWFVIWHNKESRGHNMETNHATISHYLHPSLSHTVFTCSGGHWPTGAHKIAPLQFFFFAQILLTCDPRVTNASTRERIRGTFQTSLYRQEKRGVGAKGWSVTFRLSLGDFLYDSLSFI